MNELEWVLSACLGIGLAAACGFRVFVPLLGMGIAAHAGHLTLAEGFEWIGGWPAIIAFAVATVLEIAAYYIPWLDNLLDSLATPAAVVAGTIAVASVMDEMSPYLRWTLAAIAGGGAAGTIQVGTVALRGGSTLATGGIANPLVATGEWVFSLAGTIMALIAPVLAVVAASLVIAWFIFYLLRRRPGEPALAKATSGAPLPASGKRRN